MAPFSRAWGNTITTIAAENDEARMRVGFPEGADNTARKLAEEALLKAINRGSKVYH